MLSRTEVYDAYGPVVSDPSWEKFDLFHVYLANAFPNVSVLGLSAAFQTHNSWAATRRLS